MVHIGHDTAEDRRLAREREYRYVATDEIFIDGVLAFAPGYPVPASHTEEYPQLLETDDDGNVPVVGADEWARMEARKAEEAKAAEEAEKPAAKGGRSAWANYARGQGAPDTELAAVKEGGLTRDELAAKYGADSPAGTGG